MKIQSVITLAVVPLVVSAWLVMKPHPVSGHSSSAVTKEMVRISVAAGANAMEQRTVSGSLRSSKYGIFRSFYERVSGKAMLDDTDEIWLKGGTDMVKVVMYHSRGKVREVNILPVSLPSVLADNLRTGLETKFPGVDCRVVSP